MYCQSLALANSVGWEYLVLALWALALFGTSIALFLNGFSGCLC